MNRHYFFWVIGLTLASIALIFFSMWESIKPKSAAPKEFLSYPKPPFSSYLSGLGIVESMGDNISIGSVQPRLVRQVNVHAGESVKKGAILFSLEAEDLEAELKLRTVEYEIAEARWQRIEALPRPEEVAVAKASLKTAEVALKQTQLQLEKVQALRDPRALSEQEIDQRKFHFEEALAKFQEAEAHLAQIQAPAWKFDVKIAALEAKQALASKEKIETEIERTHIRSPIDGKVLQVNIHEGELTSSVDPLMIIGNTDEIDLKVSINQFDAPYFDPKKEAIAFLRGNPHIEFALEFKKLVPYLTTKENITHDILDKSDTRVLQVIYRIKNADYRLFVGQQMDVFIEAELPS